MEFQDREAPLIQRCMLPKAIRRVANGFLSASNQGHFLIAAKHHHHLRLSFLYQNLHTDQYCGCAICRIFFSDRL